MCLTSLPLQIFSVNSSSDANHRYESANISYRRTNVVIVTSILINHLHVAGNPMWAKQYFILILIQIHFDLKEGTRLTE